MSKVKKPRPTLYPELVQLRVPAGLLAGVQRKATTERCGASEYLRRVLLPALRDAGVNIEAAQEVQP